jgi:hypothetical protein
MSRARRVLITLLLAAAISSVAAASASAVEPIEGRWTLLDGVIDVIPAGGNDFSVKQVEPIQNRCPNAPPLNMKLNGSGANYTGTVAYSDNGGCGSNSAGDGSVTITMANDNNSAHFVAKPPPSGGNTVDTTITRVVTKAKVVGELPVIVNGFLLQLQPRYKQLPFSGSSKRRQSVSKAIAKIAKSGTTRINAYQASASEQTLKTCALAGLKKVAAGAGAKSKRTIQLGMLDIARCLKGYKVLFPGGKPGGKPPPRNQPQRGPTADFVGVGTDPRRIPRVDFSFDLASTEFAPPVIKLHLSLRVACLQRGVFYLELDSADFPTIARHKDGFGRFVTFGATTYAQGLKVDFAGLVEGGGGVHGTLHAQTDPSTSTDTCSSSNFKRWNARRVN